MALAKIKLGSFAAGEIPAPILHTFRDFDGNPISMVGWSILGFFVEGPTEGLSGTMEWADTAQGKVRYTWDPTDMQTAGRYRGLMWVQNNTTNPTMRLASDQFEWEVQDGPGPTPPTTP